MPTILWTLFQALGIHALDHGGKMSKKVMLEVVGFFNLNWFALFFKNRKYT